MHERWFIRATKINTRLLNKVSLCRAALKGLFPQSQRLTHTDVGGLTRGLLMLCFNGDRKTDVLRSARACVFCAVTGYALCIRITHFSKLHCDILHNVVVCLCLHADVGRISFPSLRTYLLHLNMKHEYRGGSDDIKSRSAHNARLLEMQMLQKNEELGLMSLGCVYRLINLITFLDFFYGLLFFLLILVNTYVTWKCFIWQFNLAVRIQNSLFIFP